ncbi:MAG: DUF898 domain-containing protein [Myxococcales bacterium]|jgi:uncharacterized membrane protein YjgN (DUF898 family)|nr:DUF898 domain-containing protein [Myxococcales bacterium]
MNRKIVFSLTGGTLLVQFIIGYLLTVITFGIYLSWFYAKLARLFAEHTSVSTDTGDIRFQFTGTGGGLFKTVLVGTLLSGLTMGIYIPWFLVNLLKYFTDNTAAIDQQGNYYSLKFTGTGGGLIVTYIIGALLTGVTLGVYFPWFLVSIAKFVANNTAVISDGQQVGALTFIGLGDELILPFVVGYLLTLVTLGIYGFWFQVTMLKFMCQKTVLSVNDNQFGFDFQGTGGEYFVTVLVGNLLSSVTLGIYGAWFACKVTRFQTENIVIYG